MTKSDFHILVCNDDGFDAPGIEHLAAAVADCGRVSVVAPIGNYSGASSSLSLRRDIQVQRDNDYYFRVDGTPADCVHLALTCDFLIAKPDLIVSGINNGSNLGDDTIYSGTVAAAIEGYLFGIPALAFSMVGEGTYFAAGAKVAKRLVQSFQQKPPAGVPLWNINIPDVADADTRALEVTRLGRRQFADSAIEISHHHNSDDSSEKANPNNTFYRLGNAGAPDDDAEGTDFNAVQQGRVSLTPLTIDLTNATQIADVQRWMT